MNKIVYYFPTKKGAPSKVGRSIFQKLPSAYKSQFLYIFPQKISDMNNWNSLIGDYKCISLKDLFFLSKKDIVHITIDPHVFPNRKFLLYMIAVIKRCKIIINYHGDPREEFKIQLENKNYNCFSNILTVIFEPVILRTAHVVILNSNIMKKTFLEKYASNNICVIPNAIDSSWLEKKESLKLSSFDSNVISILYHGRLAPEKGLDLLIDALFNTYKNTNNNNFMLYIVGNGPEKKKLQELCIEYGLESNISFLENISDEELIAYLDMVNAAIYPSYYEPFSLAILEAFSRVNGPVLFSENTGIYDFVKADNYSFYTFKPEISDLIMLLTELLNSGLDLNISFKQKEFAKKYTWDIIAKEYMEVYESFISISQ